MGALWSQATESIPKDGERVSSLQYAIWQSQKSVYDSAGSWSKHEDLKMQADVVDVLPPAFIISRPTKTALLSRLLVCNVCLPECG